MRWYGCLPMSIADLMDEFENSPILEEENELSLVEDLTTCS